MNQKTLLAIILSVSVLFGYETIFVSPKRIKSQNDSQLSVNKHVIDKSIDLGGSKPETNKPTTVSNIVPKFSILKTKSIESEAINVGGSLHNIKIGKHVFPLEKVLTVKGFEDVEFRIISQDSQNIFIYENENMRITKTFQINDENTINAKITATSLKSMSSLDIDFVLFDINFDKLGLPDKRETMLDEYSVSVNKKVTRRGSASKFNAKEDRISADNLEWAAFRDHYSVFVIKPEFDSERYEIKTLTEKILEIIVTPKATKWLASSMVYEFIIYVGPQDIGLMKSYKKGWEDVVAFSSHMIIDIPEKAIYHVIPLINKVFRNWGLSIIIISILIYALTYPLTIQSMLSMRRMQQVQPKIKALQDRYKNEPTKLNAEIMEIYKREKINPLGGCLPMLLQMPIFISLYQVLWRSHYFQGQGFLWIKDLTLPDRLFILPFSLPFLGNEFNILPLLAGGVMFAQQKFSAKSMVITDEQQAMQQKMMMYLMPAFLAFIFYKFASGISLYMTVFYALSAFTQWKMSKASMPVVSK